MVQDIMSTPDIIHIRGAYPNFLCGGTFTAEYSLSGNTTQMHTASRDIATCKECIAVYDKKRNHEG